MGESNHSVKWNMYIVHLFNTGLKHFTLLQPNYGLMNWYLLYTWNELDIPSKSTLDLFNLDKQYLF